MTKNVDRLQVHTWVPTHHPEIEPEALEKFQKSSHPSTTTTKGQSNYSTTFYVSIYTVYFKSIELFAFLCLTLASM
jgi:hypothetical protein